MALRCTGRYRSVDLYGGSSANGTSIIASVSGNVPNQKWYLQPKIIGDNDISIIKVGDSTGRACVSMYNAFGSNKLNVYYANGDNLLSTNNVSKNTLFNTPHINFAIRNSSVFYVNGHGYPSPSMGDLPQVLYDITPQNIGFQTSDHTCWGILSPCSQLIEDGSAVVWANYALKKGVRGILGYYGSAPGDNGGENQPQIDKISQFTQQISNGTSFINSWRDANNGTLGFSGASTWAAIYHEEAEGDTLSTYNRGIELLTSPTIYYICLRQLKKRT